MALVKCPDPTGVIGDDLGALGLAEHRVVGCTAHVSAST